MRWAGLPAAVDEAVAAIPGFAGVVRVDEQGGPVLERAYGLADRAHGVPVEVRTRFGIASGSKAFTALVVVHLVERGILTLATTARSLLGADLPLVDDGVTVEHLLGHTSGIGDYLDEDEDDVDGGPGDDHLLPVPVGALATTEQFLAVLDGFPTKFPPGERFSYCNGGYVVLALLAERASGTTFHDLVQSVVFDPAGMATAAYLRGDELPGDVARGYLDGSGLRTNVLHLPVRGNGDGGAHAAAADITAFWGALFDGRIVAPSVVEAMVARRSEPTAAPGWGYGLGFWSTPEPGTVALEGCDAGVSFRSVHHPAQGWTATVLATTSSAAWPVAKVLAAAARGR